MASGWDPHFSPQAAIQEADVVNLGYVLSVIEHARERVETIGRAWQLARRVLVVAAQVVLDDQLRHKVPYNDGYLTSRGTFQRFFEQRELKELIEGVCATEAHAAGIGVFYVFRDETLRHVFLASRYTRRAELPRPLASQVRFDSNRELLEPLISTIEELGRLPEPNEFDRSDEVSSTFGSLRRAFAVITRVTGKERWQRLRDGRRGDVLVMLAVMRFGRRPHSQGCRLGFSGMSVPS